MGATCLNWFEKKLDLIPASTTLFERVRDSIAGRLRAERSAKDWTGFVRRIEADTGFTGTNP